MTQIHPEQVLDQILSDIQAKLSHEQQQHIGIRHNNAPSVNLAQYSHAEKSTKHSISTPQRVAFQFAYPNQLGPDLEDLVKTWIGLPISVQVRQFPANQIANDIPPGGVELSILCNDGNLWTTEKAENVLRTWRPVLPKSQDARAFYTSVEDLLLDQHIVLDWVKGDFTENGFVFFTDLHMSEQNLNALFDAFGDCNIEVTKEDQHHTKVTKIQATFPDRMIQPKTTPSATRYTELGFTPLTIPKPPDALDIRVDSQQIDRMDFRRGIHFAVSSNVRVNNVKNEQLDDYVGVRIIFNAPIWYYFAPFPLNDQGFAISEKDKAGLNKIQSGLDTPEKWIAFFNNAQLAETKQYGGDAPPSDMVKNLYCGALLQYSIIAQKANKTYMQGKDLKILGWSNDILKNPILCLDNTYGDMVWMPRKDFQSWLEKTLVVLHTLSERNRLGSVTVSKDEQPINDWTQLVNLCTSPALEQTIPQEGLSI